MPTIVWIQVDGQGIISFEGVEPSEEDFRLFREEPSPEKHFFWAEFDDKGVLVRVLDVETGEDRTSIPWVRDLALSRAPRHQC
jgi:hypothetical protein